MRVLLSIRPEYVEKIFNGEKRYEYRRQIFKRDVNKVIVYATQPEGKIVGEFSIEAVLHDGLDKIWHLTSKYSGISYSFFKSYFQGKEEGYAIKIGKVTLYNQPIDPKKIDETFKPPQSFCYIEKDILLKSKLSV